MRNFLLTPFVESQQYDMTFTPPHQQKFIDILISANSAAFVLMSFRLMWPSALCHIQPYFVWVNVAFGYTSFELMLFGLMSHSGLRRSS